MTQDDQASPNRSALSVVAPVTMALYVGWSISMAARHGMFRWGSLAEYSLFVYVLSLGLVSSAVAFAKLWDSSALAVLMICLGCGQAMMTMRPVQRVPAEMGWAFDLVAFVATYAVVAAGMAFAKRPSSGSC